MIAHFDFVPPTPFKSPIPREILQKLAANASARYRKETGKYFESIELCVEKLCVVINGTVHYPFNELI